MCNQLGYVGSAHLELTCLELTHKSCVDHLHSMVFLLKMRNNMVQSCLPDTEWGRLLYAAKAALPVQFYFQHHFSGLLLVFIKG